jgi:hypothetical protein
MPHLPRFLAAYGLLAALAATSPAYGQKKIPPVPDLTNGGQPTKSHDWTLGPTGARGWIWGFDGQTTNARQILVTSVAAGSPAEGALEKGDVILGVASKPFDEDARLAFARAVTAAETQQGEGKLRLLRRRGKKTDAVVVKLKPLGAFAQTAPYDCPKSKKLLDLACRAVAEKGFLNQRKRAVISIENDLNALLLLASGDRDYLPKVAEYAKAVADSTPGGHISWGYAYETLFLAEYALATRDAAVMPGLKRLATDIAEGQSVVGNWGHAFRRPEGDLKGYGAMNQPGVVLTLAMAIAREAGVKSKVVDEAIARGAAFLRWYVDKGALPYGDHDPWPWHEDNGKCSAAAVLFDLLGDQEAATYFSRMAVAAYGERESGHTGNFFNHLWSFPGVSRAGPAATAAYFVEAGWELELARAHDGSMPYQSTPAEKSDDSYEGWDCTGAYALAYALPLKKTILTGRRPSVVEPLAGETLRQTIDAGRDFTYWTEKTCYDGRSLEALFAGLSSWSPAVRTRSAAALGKKEGDHTSRLMRLLAGADRFGRYGAAEALARRGEKSDLAGPALRKRLADPDPWLRILAAQAIAELGKDERENSVPALLAAAAADDPADPRRRFASAAGEALFSTSPGKNEPQPILKKSLQGVDRPALYAAIRALLANEDGRIRGYVAPALRLLDDADLAELLPDLATAIAQRPPSGQMFAYEIRMVGLELFAKLRLAEGLDLAMLLLNEDEWGREFDRAARALLLYGGAAKAVLPRLEKETRAIVEKRDDDKLKKALEKLVADVRAAPAGPPTLTLAQFRAKHGRK